MVPREPNHDFILHRSPDGVLAVILRNPFVTLNLLDDNASVDTGERSVEFGLVVHHSLFHHTRIIQGG
jgi:hypothetical protein